jgi:protein gp37
MSDHTSIEWTATINPDGTVTPGATWNPIRAVAGRHTCARISPGCDNCYAATMNRRGLGSTAPLDFGRGETLIDPARLDEKALTQPLHWRRPRKIFVCSMTDLFGSWVPDAWVARILNVMLQTPEHTYIVLTKRPKRMQAAFATLALNIEAAYLPQVWPLPNVWVGVTIESDQFTWRANYLRETPAAVRWVSAEPLLSGLPSLDLTGIDWLVAGGESGAKARPMHPDWPRELRDRCAASGTAFFFKQWGNWVNFKANSDAFKLVARDSIGPNRCAWVSQDGSWGPIDGVMGADGDEFVNRLGNHRTGRLLDGREHNDYPTVAAAGVPV